MLVLSIYGKLQTCHYFVGDMVLKIFCQFQVVAKLGPLDCYLNFVPLSDKMYLGHTLTGRYSFMNVETMLSIVLSGIGNASGHPVR